MSLSVVGIPQRETLRDRRREKLIQKMEERGENGEMLPITPATVIAYGRIGSGKSSVMYSWLKNMFPRYYDEVIIFCSSTDSKEPFESLPQDEVVFLTEYDDTDFKEYIEALKENQIERMAMGKPALNVFIGFDDIVFSQAISKRGGASMVEKLMMICRHELNATVFICVQHSKQVNPAMRNNTLYNVILGVQKNDLAKIAEEHAGHLSTDEFIDVYNAVVLPKKHGFMVVDYKAPESRRFRDGWDKYIVIH
jgi:hypothetical protein